jgi:hypothetical protein
MISLRIIFLNIHSGLFFSGIRIKGLYAFLTCFMHATYVVHLIILIIFTPSRRLNIWPEYEREIDTAYETYSLGMRNKQLENVE